jgi:hypothetical protein
MTEEAFTEDDLFDEIEKYIAAGDDEEAEPETITRPEVIKQFGVSRLRAKAILEVMIEAGVLRKDRVRRHDGWRSATVNGYRLVKD